MEARFHIERKNTSEKELRIAKRCAPTQQGFMRLQVIEEPYRSRSPKAVPPSVSGSTPLVNEMDPPGTMARR